MPSKTSRKGSSKKKNKKSSDKKQAPIESIEKKINAEVGDIVTLDVKSVFITNIKNNNDPDVKNLETMDILNKNDVESLHEKVLQVNFDEAFVDDQVNNNNNILEGPIKDSSRSMSSVSRAVSEKKISQAWRKRCISLRDCKTIDDYVDAGVPRHIAEMKHPLSSTWTIWYHGNNKERTWDQNYRAIVSVSSVEDFWAVVNYLQVASKLELGCDYSLFKAGMRPDWEDSSNCGGGRWHISSSMQARESGQLDSWWTELLLILIGEQAGDHSRLVNGAVVNIKSRADKLAVWLSDSKDFNGVMAIGKLIKKRLGLGDLTKIVFSVHSEDKKKMRNGSGSSPGKISL